MMSKMSIVSALDSILSFILINFPLNLWMFTQMWLLGENTVQSRDAKKIKKSVLFHINKIRVT